MGESSEISRAVAAVAALDARRRRAMYGRAVAFGVANTQCSCERERQFGALRLLTLATLRLPDVALYGNLLHCHAREPHACCLVAQTLIGASSGAMRLAHRALEMHALELGYRAEVWVERVVDGTGDELSGTVADEKGLPVASRTSTSTAPLYKPAARRSLPLRSIGREGPGPRRARRFGFFSLFGRLVDPARAIAAGPHVQAVLATRTPSKVGSDPRVRDPPFASEQVSTHHRSLPRRCEGPGMGLVSRRPAC